MKSSKTKMRALAPGEGQELIKLRRKIVDSFEESQSLSEKARGACNAAVAEAILCGQYLTRAKQIVGHGHWLQWLRENCKGVSEATAKRYMRLARNPKAIEDLEPGASLRQAYIVAGILPTAVQPVKPAPSVDPLENIQRKARALADALAEVPADSIPEAHRMICIALAGAAGFKEASQRIVDGGKRAGCVDLAGEHDEVSFAAEQEKNSAAFVNGAVELPTHATVRVEKFLKLCRVERAGEETGLERDNKIFLHARPV